MLELTDDDFASLEGHAIELFGRRAFRACHAALEGLFALGRASPATLLIDAVCLGELGQRTLAGKRIAAAAEIAAGARAGPWIAAWGALREQAESTLKRSRR